MASTILEDLRRRAKKPQTPALVRAMLKTAREETEGGIVLPPGIVQMSVDRYRMQRIAIKIARELFFRDTQRYMPLDNCKDIRVCESEEDTPEMYRISWQIVDAQSVCPEVFAYRSAYFEERAYHFITLLFWEAFTFCMVFVDPDVG